MPLAMSARRARFPLPGLALALAALVLAGPAAAGPPPQFAAIMDQVFGRGAWRMTGGYRTPERENQLRAEGAKTVAPGRLSRHSLGSPQAPGAYDLVVDGMSPYEAAARLRRAGAPFARYQPKGAHGTQGPHLHLEPYSFDLAAAGPLHPSARGPAADAFGLPVVLTGFRRPAPPVPAMAPDPDEPDDAPAADTPEARELVALRIRAMDDRAEAQLALGRAYAEGAKTTRDLAAARAWLELAAGNPRATSEIAQTAAAELREVSERLEIDQALAQRRAARRAAAAAPAWGSPGRCPAETSVTIVALAPKCLPPPARPRAAVVLMSGS